jgi:hypothetical protein
MTKRRRAASGPCDRVAYETPRLVTFGRVDALTLTAAKAGTKLDSFTGQNSHT